MDGGTWGWGGGGGSGISGGERRRRVSCRKVKRTDYYHNHIHGYVVGVA